MPAPRIYSEEERERWVDAWLAGEGMLAVANRFGVSVSTVSAAVHALIPKDEIKSRARRSRKAPPKPPRQTGVSRHGPVSPFRSIPPGWGWRSAYHADAYRPRED